MNRKQTGYHNTFSTLALTFGILSLVTMCCIYSGIVFGALAILFSVLSKGNAVKPCSQARFGMILGIISIICTIVVYAVSYVMILQQYGGFMDYMEYYMESVGISL